MKQNHYSSFLYLMKCITKENYGQIIILILISIASISAINSTLYVLDNILNNFKNYFDKNSILNINIQLPFLNQKRNLWVWLACLLSILLLFLPELVITNTGSLLFLIIFGFINVFRLFINSKKRT